MRTILFILMLMLTLTACAGKDGSTDLNADNATAAEAAAAEGGEVVEEIVVEETVEIETTLDPNVILDPVGDVRMVDGTVHELTSFKKLGQYYIYIVGKLNGRSSTVISLTRLDDLQNWAAIQFKDRRTFTIVTKREKQLYFEDSRVYIGSDSHDTYSFYSMDPNTYDTSLIEVKKSDVAAINIK